MLQQNRFRIVHVATAVLTATVAAGQTQQIMTWNDVVDRFHQNNPGLVGAELMVRENQANEVTAGLRPNPTFTSTEDQNNFFSTNPYRPFGAVQWTQSLSQLVERRNKRQLRVDSAHFSTEQSKTDQADLQRNLVFALRDAFIRVLQGKAIVELAEENIKYYDRVINVNRERLKAGDIARVDLLRTELQRVQFDTDLVNAKVGLRTAKIALLALINEQKPIDSFDVSGAFDFTPPTMSLEELRNIALAERPDLRSLATAIQKAKADNKLAWANGSVDPTISTDYTRVGPTNTLGFGVSIPLRIFDRNQGEKARTSIEVHRTESVRTGLVANIYRDVDSAYETLKSTVSLLIPYRDQYLKQSEEVRESVSFAYQKGGASLLDLLDAQKAYRDAQVNYRNLVATYLSAANQLSMAVGREVNP
jgi:outer membrane protein, heavy metal efflux system